MLIFASMCSIFDNLQCWHLSWYEEVLPLKRLAEKYCHHQNKSCMYACCMLLNPLADFSQLACSQKSVLALISNILPSWGTKVVCANVLLEEKQNKQAEVLNLEPWHSYTLDNAIRQQRSAGLVTWITMEPSSTACTPARHLTRATEQAATFRLDQTDLDSVICGDSLNCTFC